MADGIDSERVRLRNIEFGAVEKLIGAIFTVISGCIAALLIWVGSTVQSTAGTMAVLEERSKTMQLQIQTMAANSYTAKDAEADFKSVDIEIRDMNDRVSRLERVHKIRG